jgi:chorismate synthase
MNVLGKAFRVASFGESHGACIGALVDGCPAGLRLEAGDVQRELDRRKPGQSAVTTQRSEEDICELLSGVLGGFTTGAPIAMMVRNKDVVSTAYQQRIPRPSHADYTAFVKYGGFADFKGGGRFSGRITAGFVAAGAVAKKLLSDALRVRIVAHACEIAGIRSAHVPYERFGDAEQNAVRCADAEAAAKMQRAIEEAKAAGDSVGGVIECAVLGAPAGIGEPMFDTLEGELSKAIFAVPGVKAVEFGAGFAITRMRGSEASDAFVLRGKRVLTRTNNSGGVQGGMSNGMPITMRVAIKPTASIAKEQQSVDLERMKAAALRMSGRHDPCIVPRAVPVVEAMAAITLADLSLRGGFIPKVISKSSSR